jgi:O-antigen ligase
MRFCKFLVLGALIGIPLGTAYITKDPFAISWVTVFSQLIIWVVAVLVLFRQVPLSFPRQVSSRWMAALFLGAMIWAFVWTDPLSQGIGHMISRTMQPLLVGYAVYLLARARVITKADILVVSSVSLALTIGAIALQVAGVVRSEDVARPTGWHLYPNTAAHAVVLLLVLGVAYCLTHRWTKKIWLLVGLLALGGVAVLFTLSYNASIALWVALGVGGLLVVAKRYRLWVGLGIILPFLLIAGVGPYLPKWETTIESSIPTRREYWVVASKIFQERPFTGLGLKGWEKQYPSFIERLTPNPRPLNWGSPQPHNMVWDTLMKGGIPTLIGVSAFLLYPLNIGRRLWKSGEWFGLGLILLGVSQLTFGLVDDPIWGDDVIAQLWYLYAIGAALLERQVNGEK